MGGGDLAAGGPATGAAFGHASSFMDGSYKLPGKKVALDSPR